MDHNEPVLPININGNVFVGNFPKKTFIIAAVFRFIYSKGEIITAVCWEAFFALVGIISFAFCIGHGIFLTDSGNKKYEKLKLEAILPTKF